MADGDMNASNPFGGIPFFNDMMRAMAGQGPLNWDLSQKVAQLGAVGDSPEPETETAKHQSRNTDSTTYR